MSNFIPLTQPGRLPLVQEVIELLKQDDNFDYLEFLDAQEKTGEFLREIIGPAFEPYKEFTTLQQVLDNSTAKLLYENVKNKNILTSAASGLDTFDVVKTVPISATSTVINLFSDNDFIYLVGNANNNQNAITKYHKNNLAVHSGLANSAISGELRRTAYDDNYIYLTYQGGPTNIVSQVYKSNLSFRANINVGGTIVDVATDNNGSFYASNSGTGVFKYSSETGTLITSVAATSTSGSTARYLHYNPYTNLLFRINNTTGFVSFDAENLQQLRTDSFGNAENWHMYSDDLYLYVVSSNSINSNNTALYNMRQLSRNITAGTIRWGLNPNNPSDLNPNVIVGFNTPIVTDIETNYIYRGGQFGSSTGTYALYKFDRSSWRPEKVSKPFFNTANGEFANSSRGGMSFLVDGDYLYTSDILEGSLKKMIK